MWLLSESHHSGREAQNSRGRGRPAGRRACMWAAELCALSTVSKSWAGLWNGGCFLMHASGQSRAYTPLNYFCTLLLLFFFSHTLPLPSPHFHTQLFMRAMEDTKHSLTAPSPLISTSYCPNLQKNKYKSTHVLNV